MKNILSIVVICFCFMQGYAQEAGVELTKEIICKGAAVSVVGNVKPLYDLNFTKEKILGLTQDLVKEPIKDAPSVAYELFKANKTKEEVIEILYQDFMKLDRETVMKYLINADPDDY